MSFKKQQPYQPDMFNVPQLPSRLEKQLYDPMASHNQFYKHVFCKIPEDIFSPLYCADNGRPNASSRLLCAMRAFKEGGGYSDKEMFAAVSFDLLVRKSMGMLSFDDKVPSPSTYYKFFANLCEYKARTGVDLFEEAFKEVTKKQLEEFCISGRRIRMDSTLIGSNIAHYSRYRIVHSTLVKAVSMPGGGVPSAFSAPLAGELASILGENAELQGADEAEYFRDFTLPMGELCPLVTV